MSLQEALEEVNVRVVELRTRFERRTTEATQMKIEVDKANETIAAAETLVGKLSDEHKRWSEQVGYLVVEDIDARLSFSVAHFATFVIRNMVRPNADVNCVFACVVVRLRGRDPFVAFAFTFTSFSSFLVRPLLFSYKKQEKEYFSNTPVLVFSKILGFTFSFYSF